MGLNDGFSIISGNYDKPRGHYDNALICENGHIINNAVNQFPEDNKKFCEKCGEKAIASCSNCNTKIKGQFLHDGYRRISSYDIPSFCYNCGFVFPWTLNKIETSVELASENISDPNFDKKLFKNDLNEIVKDSPKSSVAAIRVKKTMRFISNGVLRVVRDLIIDFSSETAKKILFPDK